MATKIAYGWIRKGQNKPIKTTASKTRINLSGAIDLKETKVIFNTFETIDGASTVDFLKQVRNSYPQKKKIHIILDNSSYHRSDIVKKFCENNKIKLHFLPTYSPNLNPIERLWKLMNERVRNNYFFSSPTEFRQKINGFFTEIIPSIPDALQSRISDRFQVVSSAC
jgi:transposase